MQHIRLRMVYKGGRGAGTMGRAGVKLVVASLRDFNWFYKGTYCSWTWYTMVGKWMRQWSKWWVCQAHTIANTVHVGIQEGPGHVLVDHPWCPPIGEVDVMEESWVGGIPDLVYTYPSILTLVCRLSQMEEEWMAVNIVQGEKSGGLNFVTCYTFRVLVFHIHRCQCPTMNDHFAALCSFSSNKPLYNHPKLGVWGNRKSRCPKVQQGFCWPLNWCVQECTSQCWRAVAQAYGISKD